MGLCGCLDGFDGLRALCYILMCCISSIHIAAFHLLIYECYSRQSRVSEAYQMIEVVGYGGSDVVWIDLDFEICFHSSSSVWVFLSFLEALTKTDDAVAGCLDL